MISRKEKTLLRYMRQNSRQSLSKISRETNIPVSTLFDILKRLESKVIWKHVTFVDFAKLGWNLKASFVVGSRKKKELKDFLMKSRHVNSLSSLINEYDFYAECIFRDIKDMERFKEQLEKLGVDKIEENFIVEEIKKEGFSP